MNHDILGKILAKEVRFPQNEVSYATLTTILTMTTILQQNNIKIIGLYLIVISLVLENNVLANKMYGN